MTQRERRLLLTLGLLVIVMVLAIGVTFYVTRIVPLDNAARAQVEFDVTARQREADRNRAATERARD